MVPSQFRSAEQLKGLLCLNSKAEERKFYCLDIHQWWKAAWMTLAVVNFGIKIDIV